jgi:hypothetical protein
VEYAKRLPFPVLGQARTFRGILAWRPAGKNVGFAIKKIEGVAEIPRFAIRILLPAKRNAGAKTPVNVLMAHCVQILPTAAGSPALMESVSARLHRKFVQKELPVRIQNNALGKPASMANATAPAAGVKMTPTA